MVNYNQPTLDWKDTSVPSAQDFNRIEGNIDYLSLKKGKMKQKSLSVGRGFYFGDFIFYFKNLAFFVECIVGHM